ncbi:MAG: isopenicillin N synthase family oxygenase [Actinomycetota bacterium]|nr:isopenicillin N synthase family oxygenase [Actinomycetota bacterium]
MTAPLPVPAIDLGGPVAEVARAIDTACSELGFFAVTGHGVRRSLIVALMSEARAFFDRPLADRLLAVPSDGRPRGFTPFQSERAAYSLGRETPPDLLQAFGAGREPIPDEPYYRRGVGRFIFDNVWPPDAEGLRAAYADYWAVVEPLGRRLMAICALALDLDQGFFEPFIDRSIGQIRVSDYPALDHEPQPGQLRSGEHTDFGSITILAVDGIAGLELRDDQGQYRPAAVPDGALVINVGDLLARWTNDRWQSTYHRVAFPSSGPPYPRRLSIAFFQSPNYDAVIECLPTCTGPNGPAYPPIRSGDHVLGKINATVSGGQD